MYATIVYFYLLNILMLGGCNHIRHQHPIHNGNQRRGTYASCVVGTKGVIDKLIKIGDVKQHSLKAQNRSLKEKKEKMIEDLMNYARCIIIKSKHSQAHPVDAFRKEMNQIVVHYCHPNNHLICWCLHLVAVDHFHEAVKNILDGNIPDNVISCFLIHVEAHTKHQPNRAKMYADAIADTAINAALYILTTSLGAS